MGDFLDSSIVAGLKQGILDERRAAHEKAVKALQKAMAERDRAEGKLAMAQDRVVVAMKKLHATDRAIPPEVIRG